MKFTRTAVAVAIAGFAAAPMMASADTTLSGVVEVQVDSSDADGDEPTIAAGDVLFGFASDHEMNSGLTAYGSLRVDANRLSNEGSTTVDPGTPTIDDDDIEITTLGSIDSVFVGFKGGFGDVRFGEVPNAAEYGQVANDIFDVAADINGGVSYTGTFGGFGVGVSMAPESNEDVIAVGAKFSIGGFAIGVGAEDRAEAQAVSAGVSFAFAGASIAVNGFTKDGGGPDDITSATVKVGYGFGGVSAGLTVAMQDDNGAENEALRLDLSYGLGGGLTASTRIDVASDNDDTSEDITAWRVKLSKTF